MEHRNFPRLSFFITAKPLEHLKIFPAPPNFHQTLGREGMGRMVISKSTIVRSYQSADIVFNIQNGGHVNTLVIMLTL